MNQLNFGQALDAIKAGKRIARTGWNGKGMFVYLVPPASYPVQTGAAKAHFGEGAMVPYNAYMAIKNVDSTISTWVPSVNDCLAEDWGLVGDDAAAEGLHDWRHSSSYGGQLCAGCGAVHGSRRGSAKCQSLDIAESTTAASTTPPHQQRVLDEKQDLDLRIARLDEFMRRNPTFPTLDAAERDRLEIQLDLMRDLSGILGERIAAF